MLTSSMLSELLCSLSIIGGLLLLGTFLRSKIKIFQKLFLPASVIGGFIGLLLGPIVLGDYALFKIPDTYINNWSLLPGILIIPIFASVPLGMFMNKQNNLNSQSTNTATKSSALYKVLMAFGVFAAISCFQSVIGFATNILFTNNGTTNLYTTFGYELSQGFSGGHGTAGAVGRIMEDLGFSYWATAQGVATTTATIGIIGGMIFGIIFINIAARKGKTSILKSGGNISTEISKGYINDITKQKSIGRESFANSSIEVLSFHLAIILGVCGIAYYLMGKLKATGIAAFSNLPVWIYAMVIMFAVNQLIILLKLDWAIDSKVKSRISGCMSDFAITAAIASLPVKAVLEFAKPIFVMCVLGFIASYVCIFIFQSFLFKGDYAFERSIIAWGAATGVMITGMMLLKICDPDYETPALTDFSIGFSILSLSGLITSPIITNTLATGSTWDNLIVNLLITLAFWAIALVAKYLLTTSNKKIKNLEKSPILTK